jgi:hypothetical protein
VGDRSHDISNGPSPCRVPGTTSLLTELDAFFTDHHDCGDLDAGVEGPVVWIACECGARMARRADADDRA